MRLDGFVDQGILVPTDLNRFYLPTPVRHLGSGAQPLNSVHTLYSDEIERGSKIKSKRSGRTYERSISESR